MEGRGRDCAKWLKNILDILVTTHTLPFIEETVKGTSQMHLTPAWETPRGSTGQGRAGPTQTAFFRPLCQKGAV